MDQPLQIEAEGYYSIEGSQTLWLKLNFEPQSAIVISAAHTSFFKNQTWSIRMWISNQPLGPTVTREPLNTRSFVNPLKNPVRFGLFDYAYNGGMPAVPDVIWLQPASPELTYYVNIRNLENRANAFFLKVDTLYP